MKVVILAGGKGTRLAEETVHKPKPMVDIGGFPIIWHIMTIYSHFGFNDFYIALGYKGDMIKDYFLNYHKRQNDMTITLKSGDVKILNPVKKEWSVTLIDTGQETMTGGRLLRLKPHLESAPFMLTYGDGLATINIPELIKKHQTAKRLATVSAVRPAARFGALTIDGDQVTRFVEKSQADEGWINGGFFVFEPQIFNYIENDQMILEKEPLEQLTKEAQLSAYHHPGYWRCMDTLRDKEALCREWPDQMNKNRAGGIPLSNHRVDI
ncbi:MAG: glucose-1-phosphate cytidylyltransferase [bacterium]